MTATLNVAVIGAGPAGSAAAIELAKTGASVALVDKAIFPRDKCCGDGLTTAALRHLEDLGLDLDTIPSLTRANDLIVRSPSGRVTTVPLGEVGALRAAVAPRRELDAALLGVALRAGAVPLLGAELLDLRAEDDAVVLELKAHEPLRARHVIGADGAWSRVARCCDGRSTPASEWTAFRTYASGVGELAARHLHVVFAPFALPGYLWSFPLSGERANLGVYVRRDAHAKGQGLHAAWERARQDPYLVSILGPNARLEQNVRAWPIPTAFRREPGALGGRVLFCGDALGAADPFTGEGIAQALETGRLAARALTGPDPIGTYSAALAAGPARDHRLAEAMSSAFRSPIAARLAVRGTGLTDRVAREVGRFLYEDYRRADLFAPTRWSSAAFRPRAPFSGRA